MRNAAKSTATFTPGMSWMAIIEPKKNTDSGDSNLSIAAANSSPSLPLSSSWLNASATLSPDSSELS